MVNTGESLLQQCHYVVDCIGAELPLPDPPTRQRSNHETDDAASITSDRMSAHDLANTSMPTEVLRHLGESRNNSRAELAAAHGQDEDDALDAPTLALKRIALSNAWDPQLATWSQLQSVIRARIQRVSFSLHYLDRACLSDLIGTLHAQHFTEFESQEAALFDKALDPPWTLTADQVSSLKDDTIALLQRFDDPDKPPFTLQRLAELAWTPKPYYASLPKYVRAVQRCLLVCSSQSDFPPEEALSTLPSAQLHPSITHPLGGDTTLTMRGRSTSNSSESSDSASLASASLPSTPLLSPIPWLNNKRSPTPDAPDNSMASNGANGSADSSASSQSILSPPLAASHPVASPTGGRIDELECVLPILVL